MSIDTHLLKRVTEAAILASGKPLTITNIQDLFIFDDEPSERPSKAAVQTALDAIQSDFCDRGFELKEVASGWRFQVTQDLSPWVGRLWDEKPQKYSRALLETLSLIAYRQPITRGEIEEIRGVAVSSHIVKTLSERQWVKVIGHKDVVGRPAMYATTKDFLDYFNMSSLEDLPTLAEIRDLDSMNKQLNLEGVATDVPVSTTDEFGLNDKLEGMTEEQISKIAADEVLEENRQAQERLLAASMDDDLFDGVESANDTSPTDEDDTHQETAATLSSAVDKPPVESVDQPVKVLSARQALGVDVTNERDEQLTTKPVESDAPVKALSARQALGFEAINHDVSVSALELSEEQAETALALKEEQLAEALEAELEAELEAAILAEREDS